MPDTVVPLVRRAVRRTSTTPADPKLETTATAGIRKLSIGGETNRRASVDEHPSPSEVRRSWAKRDSPKEEKRLPFAEEPLPPAPQPPAYEVPQYRGAYPVVGKDNLPALQESRHKTPKTERDLELEHKVLQWIMSIIHEQPSQDYDHFIQDGSVLSKVMTSIVFNSVPLEQIDDNWGVNPVKDRVKAVIREIRRYGVVDVFEPEDLMELKNIPKVTRCLAQLSKLAASDKDNLLSHHG